MGNELPKPVWAELVDLAHDGLRTVGSAARRSIRTARIDAANAHRLMLDGVYLRTAGET